MLPQFLACRSGASSVASAQEAFLLRIDDLMTDPQNQTVPPGPEPHWVVELQGLLLSTEGLDAFLRELAVVTVRALPAAVACGVTLQPDGRPRTVSASGELAMQVDEIQYSVNAGPCLDAMRTGDVHYVRDFGAETRWPQFTTAALGYGVRGCLSTPLQILNGSAGALNVYAATVDALTRRLATRPSRSPNTLQVRSRWRCGWPARPRFRRICVRRWRRGRSSIRRWG
jgi:hypothetical protein